MFNHLGGFESTHIFNSGQDILGTTDTSSSGGTICVCCWNPESGRCGIRSPGTGLNKTW